MLVTLLDLLLLISPILAFARVYVPWAAPPPGALVRRTRLPLLARLRLHRPSVVVVAVLAAAGLAAGAAHAWAVVATMAALVLVLAIPVTCTLTDEGIAVGRRRFRRWTEFGGVARRPGGARLQGGAGSRGLMIWLSGSRDDDEFVLLLRQLVRGSYKGEIGPGSREAPSGEPARRPPALRPVSADR